MQMSAHSEHPDERPDLAARMGEVLRTRRDEQGLTLRAAALRAGLSPAHLSEVERGRKELSLSRLADVAEALDTTPGEVFLDLAVALGAAPPPPVRHPLGFAPDPRDELSWVSQKLPDPELRAVAAFGSFLIAQQKGGQRQWPR